MWLDEVEFDRFLTAAAGSEYYEYFSTLALTGARRGEALGLTWRDMDLDIISPKISIRQTVYKLDNGQWRYEEPKTDRSRRDIPLPVSLALLLQRLREQKEAYAKWCGREFSGWFFTGPTLSIEGLSAYSRKGGPEGHSFA